MRQRKLLTIGVGALLLMSMVAGAGLSGAVASTDTPSDITTQDDNQTEEQEEEESVDVSQVQVPAQEAIGIAENESNGTVVGVELATEAPDELGADNETETEDQENETLVWEIELVTQNGIETEVLIDATDGTVLDQQTESVEQDQAENEENEGEC